MFAESSHTEVQSIRSKDGMCAGHCHECYLGMSPMNNCKMCKHKFYLFDGACVKSCPANRKPTGKGSFDRKCLFPGKTERKKLHPLGAVAATNSRAMSQKLTLRPSGSSAAVANPKNETPRVVQESICLLERCAKCSGLARTCSKCLPS